MAELSIKTNKFMSKKIKLVFPKWIRSWRHAGIVSGITMFLCMENLGLLIRLRSVKYFFRIDNMVLLLFGLLLCIRWSSIKNHFFNFLREKYLSIPFTLL